MLMVFVLTHTNLFVRLHDDCDALPSDLGQHLQRVHCLLAHGGIGRGDLPHQVMGHHVEALVLGAQQLVGLLLVLQRRSAAHQQLLQRRLRHGDGTVRHLRQ